MTLVAPQALRAARTMLRRFTLADAAAFGEFMARPENTRFMTFPDAVKNREAAAHITRDTVAAYTEPTAAMALAICRTTDPIMIGACGAFETEEREIEIFYLILEGHRGRGYATEAARLLVEYLRLQDPSKDVTACIDPKHTVSQRVLERLGFVDGGPRTTHGKIGRHMVCAAEHMTS